MGRIVKKFFVNAIIGLAAIVIQHLHYVTISFYITAKNGRVLLKYALELKCFAMCQI